MNATLVGRYEPADGLMILRIALDGEDPLEFEPGQFVSIGLPEPGGRFVHRPYSIASAPGEELELFVRKIPGGRFTPQLGDLTTGDRLLVARRCMGQFGLAEVPAHASVVAVATGTGLAPFLSMLRHLDRTGARRRMALVHGVRRAPELGFRNELERLTRTRPELTYVPICSREHPGAGWDGLRGRVGDVLASRDFESLTGFGLNPLGCHVLLCGNPAMVDDQIEVLGRRGFRPHSRRRPGTLHAERYWRAEAAS